MKYISITIFTSVVFVLFFLSTYFSMLKYSDNMSSSCFECSYLRDIIVFSIIGCILILIISLVLKKLLKNKLLSSIISTILFSFLLFLNNYNIFTDRVSSWSSYGLMDEVLSIIQTSYLQIVICSLLFWFLIKMNRKNER